MTFGVMEYPPRLVSSQNCIRLVRRMVDNRDDGFRGPQ